VLVLEEAVVYLVGFRDKRTAGRQKLIAGFDPVWVLGQFLYRSPHVVDDGLEIIRPLHLAEHRFDFGADGGFHPVEIELAVVFSVGDVQKRVADLLDCVEIGAKAPF